MKHLTVIALGLAATVSVEAQQSMSQAIDTVASEAMSSGPSANLAEPEPTWIDEQREQDRQYEFGLRQLERTLRQVEISAKIQEQRFRIAELRRQEEEAQREADQPSAPRPAGPNPLLDQPFFPGQNPLLAATQPPVRESREDKEEPKAPPLLMRIVNGMAVVNYDNNTHRLRVGDELPDGFVVRSIAFDAVVLKTPNGTLKLSTHW